MAEERLTRKRDERLRKPRNKWHDKWLDNKLEEDGGMIQRPRLRRDMLSSQTLCFNLLGMLALDLDLATELVNALWSKHIGELWDIEPEDTHVRRVTGVCFEWAPQPKDEYLNDGTAFDAFIEYEMEDGQKGFIGIETKLTEKLLPDQVSKGKPLGLCKIGHHKSQYAEWKKYLDLVRDPESPWDVADREPDTSDEDGDKEVAGTVVHKKYDQILRDHLLAWALLKRSPNEYARGSFAVVYHPEDTQCIDVIDDYRELLRNEERLPAWASDLGTMIERWKAVTTEKWLSDFEERYLDLARSESARKA